MPQLHGDADILAKVEVVINHLYQLLQHVVHGLLVSAVNGPFNHFVQCEFIDAFVVAVIGHPEDGIGDVTANQLGYGLDHIFFSADDQLIDDVQLVSFLLCLRLCSDGGKDCFAGCCCELVSFFFAALMAEPAVIASIDVTSMSRLLPLLRSFSMPLSGLLGLNLLMSTCRMPFCNSRMALCVYWPCSFV